jgi:hypothetical protein
MVPTLVGGVLVILLVALIAVGGLALVQHFVPLEIRESHSNAIGITYGALSIMFGVIVGFTAYLVLNKYTTSQNTAQSEAGDVVEIYRLADQLAPEQRDQIQEVATSYTQVVVDEEWPLMQQGQTSPHAEALAEKLRRSIQGVEPSTSVEQALYSQMLERAHDLDQHREVRMLNVREGLPPVLWIVIMILGGITLLFTYFLGMESVWLHSLAVAALAVGITLIMVTMFALDSPFGTDVRVGPEAFKLALQTMEGNGEQQA